MRRFWIFAVVGAGLGLALAAMFAQAMLYDNPQGEYCRWLPTEDWTSPDWADKCSLTVDFYVGLAVAFGYGFMPLILIGGLWAAVDFLTHRRKLSD